MNEHKATNLCLPPLSLVRPTLWCKSASKSDQ